MKPILLFFICLPFGIYAQTNKECSKYIGYVPIKSLIDESQPQYKWYHETTITIVGDTVSIRQVPLSIYKNDTLYSSSDGGFYNYEGSVNKKKNGYEIFLQQKSCDYCAVEVQKDQNGAINKKLIKWNGSRKGNKLIIKNVSFKKVTSNNS